MLSAFCLYILWIFLINVYWNKSKQEKKLVQYKLLLYSYWRNKTEQFKTHQKPQKDMKKLKNNIKKKKRRNKAVYWERERCLQVFIKPLFLYCGVLFVFVCFSCKIGLVIQFYCFVLQNYFWCLKRLRWNTTQTLPPSKNNVWLILFLWTKVHHKSMKSDTMRDAPKKR